MEERTERVEERMNRMNVYIFDKTVHERIEEYTDILWSNEKIIPASQIHSEWVCETEIVIETVGWQALWDLSLSACEEFGVPYPTMVKVEVLSVEFSSLSALVKIIAVQDDISLPEKHNVDLIELYLTLKQENTELDIEGTAHCIDKLRFFYNYLWMPWDQDDDDNVSWVSEHLETRVRLASDMKRGVIDKKTCELIRSLIKEGNEIEKNISILETTISDEEDIAHSDIARNYVNETCQLVELNLRLQQIKSEIQILEDPIMRELFVRSRFLAAEKEKKKDRKNVAHLVLDGTVKELKETIVKIQNIIPENLHIRVCGYLDEALHASEMNDIILVSEGDHLIKAGSRLMEGGTIKGISDREKTILCPKEPKKVPCLFDLSNDEVCLDNICIEVGEHSIGIIARKGIVKITNCRIRVQDYCLTDMNCSTVKFATVVMPSAKLIIENSILEGFACGVVILGTGQLILNNCEFLACLEGIQISDNGSIDATECTFQNFQYCAVRMETLKYLHGTDREVEDEKFHETWIYEYPNIPYIPEIGLKNCKFINNKTDFKFVPKSFAAVKKNSM